MKRITNKEKLIILHESPEVKACAYTLISAFKEMKCKQLIRLGFKEEVDNGFKGKEEIIYELQLTRITPIKP